MRFGPVWLNISNSTHSLIHSFIAFSYLSPVFTPSSLRNSIKLLPMSPLCDYGFFLDGNFTRWPVFHFPRRKQDQTICHFRCSCSLGMKKKNIKKKREGGIADSIRVKGMSQKINWAPFNLWINIIEHYLVITFATKLDHFQFPDKFPYNKHDPSRKPDEWRKAKKSFPSRLSRRLLSISRFY